MTSTLKLLDVSLVPHFLQEKSIGFRISFGDRRSNPEYKV